MEISKQAIKDMNLFQRMSAISTEISTVAKNLQVGSGSASYKAVGEKDVLNAVKPIEAKYGVYSYPCEREIVDSDVMTSIKRDRDGSERETTQLFMRIKTSYKFVNMDNPTETIVMTTYADGVDSQDKACGKAMTYADKYALLKAYKIETGDDPDQEASEPLKSLGDTRKASPKQVELLKKNYVGDNLDKLLKANNIASIEDLPMKKANEIISKLYGGKNNG